MTQIRKSSKQILRNRQQKRVFYLISLSTDLILGESELVSKLGLCHFSKFIAYQISQKKQNWRAISQKTFSQTDEQTERKNTFHSRHLPVQN